MKTSLHCNSLKWSHFWKFLFSFKRSKGAHLLQNSVGIFFGINPNRVFLFGSARMSIYSIIKTNNWTEKDEIIVVGYTCVVVTNAISYSGVKAVYADINEDTLNIETSNIHSLVNHNTKAIIISHNFGIVYEDIQLIKDQYPDLLIIEDAAHTFGSKDNKGDYAGLLGDASYFSLEYSKAFTTGMGGVLIVNNEELKSRIEPYYQSLTKYPRISNIKILLTLKTHLFTSKRLTIKLKWKSLRLLNKLGLMFNSSQEELDGKMPEHYPVKLGNNLAYLGYLQCEQMDSINKYKSEVARSYSEIFTNISRIKHYYHPDYNYVRYPILFDEDVSLNTILQIKSDLKKIGIITGEWFNDVIHPKGSFRYNYNEGECPVGESISRRIINLPVNIHYALKPKDFDNIKSVFKKYLGSK